MTIVNGGIINTGGGGSSSSSSTNALSDGLACFTGSFSGVTTTSISHNLNSSALVVEFKDTLGNLLIPDTWSITNPNVIEAEFSPAATGDVTIVACITSGLAAITGGVTTIEGLSGIVDLDSSNGSIVITTSGQVINLNAIFTPASGAVLEQKCRDIDILSGLIDAGGGGAGGVSTINGISGTITLTSTNNGLEVGVNGQSIEFTPLFTYTSGQIIDQHSQDLLTLSGLILPDGGQTSVEGISGVIDLEGLDGTMVITVDGQTIQLSGLYNPTSGLIIDQHSVDLLTLSGLIGTGGGSDAGQTSINGLSGTLTLTSPDGTILIGDGPQAIHLSGLFTTASGALIQQHSTDLLTLSGLILSDGGQTSIEGVSGVVGLEALDGTMVITVDGQTIQLSGLFNPSSGEILEQKCRDIDTLSGLILSDGGQTSVNGLSGVVSLISPDNSILIGDSPQAIELSGLFTATSGALIEQHSDDLLTLSGLIIDDSGQTSINGLSGVVAVTSPDGSILIGDSPLTLELSGIFTTTSGALLQQKCADIDTLSGLVTNHMDSGQTSINGLSGLVSISGVNLEVTTSGQTILVSGIMNAASGAVLEQKCDDIITLSGLILADPGQTSINGLSGVVTLTSPDNSILIGDSLQSIELSGLFTATSGALVQQHSADLLTLSGLVGTGGGGGGGVTSINSISGIITLASPDNSVGINVDGQSINLTVDTSGACSSQTFTPADGTLFTVTHGLNTLDFTWNLWRTDTDPHTTTIGNVAPSGLNHAVVDIAAPINGKLVIQGCASSGTRTDVIGTKTITDHYTTSTIDSAVLVDASSGGITVTLHNPSGFNGKSLYLKKIDPSGTSVTLNANGSGLIDGANTAIITSQYEAIRATAHDGNWWIL